MSRASRMTLLKTAVWLICLAPLGALGWYYHTDDLTADPIAFITRHLGIWAFRFLLAALALTPLRIVAGWLGASWSWPVSLRRLLGLFAFAYAALHLGVWVVVDHYFDWPQMGADIVKRPYITVGMLALTAMVPLAITSTQGMIRRLGGRSWRRLHRLVFLTGVCAALHYLWLVKAGNNRPYWYAIILAVLLGVRAADWLRRRSARLVDRPAVGAHPARQSAPR
jgi:sulfoxide reductase heme-binding subunit YedZ